MNGIEVAKIIRQRWPRLPIVLFSAYLDDAVRAEATAAGVTRTLEKPEVRLLDISMLIGRLSRPLPGGFAGELNDQLAHRHLELVIGGLRARSDGTAAALPGPAMTLEDLRDLRAPTRSAESDVGKPLDGGPATDDQLRTNGHD